MRKRSSDEEAVLLFFAQLQRDTATTLIDTCRRYLAGQISIAQLTAAFTRTLTGAHTQAAHLGRRLAGVTDPVDPTDAAFAAAVMMEQSGYLRNLIGDILGGRYPAGADGSVNGDLKRRIQMYAERLRGSANRTWLMGLPERTMVNWTLHPAEHCADCIDRADGSPYDAATIPWTPGDGSSECTVNCKCTLEVVGGGSAGF